MAQRLDLDRITAAALTRLDADGPDRLTIRAVADELGVTPMALYHHVENKSALIALVVERALRERPLPSPIGEDWREDLWQFAVWLRETLQAHPGIAPLRLRYNVWTPALLAMSEQWINLWHASDLELQRAGRAAIATGTAVLAMVQHQSMTHDFEPPDQTMLAWLPSVRAVFETAPTDDEMFELVVRSLIEGAYDVMMSTTELEAIGSRPTRR